MHCITGLQLIVAFLLAWAHCNSQVSFGSCSSFPCITFFEAVQVIQAFQFLAATSERLTGNKNPHDNCQRSDRATLHSKHSVGR